MREIKYIAGGSFLDDRGEVSFVNGFSFENIKRFYTVSNHCTGFVRAWHGHKKEAKHCIAVNGSFLVCAVKVNNWHAPSTDLPIQKFVLSVHNPGVLSIPAGYVNGFMSLTPQAKILFFSSSPLEESLNDDIRFPARHWDPWSLEER